MSPRAARVALTGGIATGKSHVRRRLEAAGVPTLDADALARDALAPASDATAAVRRRFGESIVSADGVVNRGALGRLVFADDEARRDLEAIVHPRVHERIERWFANLDAAREPMGVADIPLLFETGRAADFDRVIVAVCDPERQVERMIARDGLAREDALARLRAQWPIGRKAALADDVIDTNGDVVETDRQVEALHRRLTTLYRADRS